MLALSSCEGCFADTPLAELEQRAGSVDRDRAAQRERWHAADVGVTFEGGDGLRTGEDGQALLQLRGGARLRVRADTIVRFPGGREGRLRVDVETGEAVLEAGDEQLRVQTALGLAILEPGSTLRMGSEDGRVELTVLVGSAVLETGEERVALSAGESFEVQLGVAELLPAEEEDSAVAQAPAPREVPSLRLVRGVGRVRTTRDAEWRELEPDPSPVGPGTGVRLETDATASLQWGGGEVELAGDGAFSVARTGDDAVIVATSGRIVPTVNEGTVSIRVPGAAIAVQAQEGGASTEIDVGSRHTVVRARRGPARVRLPDGERLLADGEELTIAAPSARAVPGPSRADLVARAGGSFTVHAGEPPVVVGLEPGDVSCPDGVVIRLGGRSSRAYSGIAAVNVPLGRGNHHYTLHCAGELGTIADEELAHGSVRVLADPGQRRLPRTPPATTIDADGHTYSVLYQNHLPTLIVQWSTRHPGPYVLDFTRGGGRERRIERPSPRFVLASGWLPEGEHQLRVTGASGRASRLTSVRVSFDNATPAAQIREPEDGSFGPGDPVAVSGLALPGWRVDVNGQQVPMDRQHRFAGRVTASGATSALAIRLTHPQRGVHYYLRRARDSQP